MYTFKLSCVALAASFVFATLPANAQDVPSSADAGRLLSEEHVISKLPVLKGKVETNIEEAQTNIPEGVENITIRLSNIRLDGVSTFMAYELAHIYEGDLGKEISLGRIWEIAEQITQYYRDQGYFLSRAYVPAQEIDEHGNIVINVIEGYVGEVEMEGSLKEKRIIRQMIEGLMAHKPVKVEKVESFLLQLNDLAGVSVRAVLEPSKVGDEASVKLALIRKEKKSTASVGYDNFGSRFLGPHQIKASYTASLLPLQRTELSLTGTSQIKELKQANIRHTVPIYRGLNLEVQGSLVRAEPGHTLKVNDIESKSSSLEVGANWQIKRQRLENLSLGLKMVSKNSESDIAGVELTRDKIRALRASINYDFADRFKGYNIASLNVTQGLNFMGASEAGDLNLSRARAKPDFSKIEASYTKFQNIYENWLFVGGLAGQWASGPLYSSEEFGYGGQAYGRAYDPSEITGDKGVSGTVEMRYQGISSKYGFNVTPYAFYDFGKVWNDDAALDSDDSASSTGLGVRLAHEDGLSGGFSVAQPLTRDIENPQYGSGKSPRILVNMKYAFSP